MRDRHEETRSGEKTRGWEGEGEREEIKTAKDIRCLRPRRGVTVKDGRDYRGGNKETAIFNAHKRRFMCLARCAVFPSSLFSFFLFAFSLIYFFFFFFFSFFFVSRCVIRDPNRSEALRAPVSLLQQAVSSSPPTIVQERSGWGGRDDRNLYNARNGFSSIPGAVGKRMTDPFEARDSSF